MQYFAILQLSIEQQDALRCGRLRQDLCGCLLKQCNVNKRSITLHGLEYMLNPKTFTSMNGIGDGGTPIVLVGEEIKINDLQAKYCIGKNGIPISTIADKLKKISCTDEDFYIMLSLL